MIWKNEGLDIEVKRVLERNLVRCKELGVDENIVTQNIDDIVNDDEIQIVAEFFGGVEPAKSFLIKALQHGKSIVTANKEMFAKSWHELEIAAKRAVQGCISRQVAWAAFPSSARLRTACRQTA